MHNVEPTIVRKHFIFVQESQNISTDELEQLKRQINSLSDVDIKKKIKEHGIFNCDLFNKDDITWVLENLNIAEIYPRPDYTNLQGIPINKKESYVDICNKLRDLDESQLNSQAQRTIKRITNTTKEEIERIKRLLPIFIEKIGEKNYVRDGQSRIATLCFNGEKSINAYVAHIN